MKDLSTWMNTLRASDLLVTVNDWTDPDDVAFIAQNNSGKATLFEKVTGYDIPLLVNSISTRRMLALALECTPDEIESEYAKRIVNPIAPQHVDSAPCKEVRLLGDKADLTQFPIHLQHEHDGGVYLSAAVQFARDPNTGKLNMGMYRMMFRKKNEAGFDMTVHHHLWHYLREKMKTGKSLEVACVIGLHPLDMLAAASQTQFSDIENLGGLRRAPVDMVRCETIDVDVPSSAHIVIEGELLPAGWVGDEGPFGEVTGSYGMFHLNPIFRVKAITRRKNSVLQSVTIGYSSGIDRTDTSVIEISTFHFLASRVLQSVGIQLVSIRRPSFGFMLVSIKKKKPGDGMLAVKTILEKIVFIKYVYVFDEDIDTSDDRAMFWALAYRTQPSQSTYILNDAPSSPLDPTISSNGRTSKLGIDATKPEGSDQFLFIPVRPPHWDQFGQGDNTRKQMRSKTYTENDIENISLEIYNFLKDHPASFYEVLEHFREKNYRGILIAWGRLREQNMIARDSSTNPAIPGWKYAHVPK